MERWNASQAAEWFERVGPVRGCNYLPRTAVNDIEMWQAESFDPAALAEELAWAADWGYNSLRVFLQYAVWTADPDGLKQRIAQFLSLAAARRITVMLVLFDDCAFGGNEPRLGKQLDPVPGVHNSRWVPSPALNMVTDRAAWKSLEAYVKDIVAAFGSDSRVLLWDLYNEPGNSNMKEKSLPLVEAAFAWARSVAPRQPLTTGPWEDFNTTMSKRMLELSDIVSFHAYDSPAKVEEKIELCGRFGRPLLCTEWLCRATGNVPGALLPIFARHRVGWYHWGLVAGRTQTYLAWSSKAGDPVPAVWQHDVLHPDGRPFDLAEMQLISRYATHK